MAVGDSFTYGDEVRDEESEVVWTLEGFRWLIDCDSKLSLGGRVNRPGFVGGSNS